MSGRASSAPAVAPADVGSLLFTLMEAHPGQAIAYNRWYERDHFYAGALAGPGAMAGRRFVATAAAKDCRPAPDPQCWPAGAPASAGTFCALYWIQTGRHDEWMAWGVAEVERLRAAGRMYAARDHVHTDLYAVDAHATAGVPLVCALDHPFAGLVAHAVELPASPPGRDTVRTTVRDTAGDSAADSAADSAGDSAGDAALAGAVAGVVASGAAALGVVARPLPMPDAVTGEIARLDRSRRRLVLWFTEDDPAATWATRWPRLDGVAASRTLFALPLVPTVPGIDIDPPALGLPPEGAP